MPTEVLDVELPSGDRVRASVSYYWSDSHAGDRPRSWVVVESIECMDCCCLVEEGENLLPYLGDNEVRRIEQLIEER